MDGTKPILPGIRAGLSSRLALLAAYAPAVATLADIGTDHGGLLTALVEAGKIHKGIGVELREGPYRRAAANVGARGLADRIELRLGDGLQPLKPGEAQACAIAGLGGGTVVEILEKSPAVLDALSYLLLQPMSQAGRVRCFLQRRGWRIVRETLVEDRDILYPIILAEPGSMPPLSPAEAEFGPLLLAARPPLLARALALRIQGLRRICDEMEKSASAASRQKEASLRVRIAEWEDLLR